MSKLEQDAPLNRRLIHGRAGRNFLVNDDARWGELILPARNENPDKTEIGLRVMLIASTSLGYVALQTVTAYEQRYPDRLNLVGVVTDDPINPDAKIGVKKRVWKFYDFEQRLEVETATVEAALTFGVPVYTGEIKVDWFHEHAALWRPDVILVCVFGQVIDLPIIQLPPYGIYNLHPSDLAHHHGAGLAPYDDLVARNAATTVWTVHHVSEEVDAGHIVGHSPTINVRTGANVLPDQAMLVYDKVLDPLGYMVYFLLDALAARYVNNAPGPIERIDFEGRFPELVKARIMEPVTDDRASIPELEPDAAMFDLH